MSVSLDKVVQAYAAIRDARAAKRQQFDAEDAVMETDQHKLKALMLQLLNETGAKSIATDHGTAYRSEKIKVAAADWNVIYDWIREDPDRFEALEKRLKSTFVKQYMDDNDGAVPPGMNVHREYEITVRRAPGPRGETP